MQTWCWQRAAAGGFLVLLAPCYAGISGGEEGWYREMVAAGPEKLRRYGEYLGRRYRDFKNIVWVNAGDYDPPDKSLVRAVAEGIKSEDPEALQTAQGSPESSTLDYWGPEAWVQLNAVYTYRNSSRIRPERTTGYSCWSHGHKGASKRTPRRLCDTADDRPVRPVRDREERTAHHRPPNTPTLLVELGAIGALAGSTPTTGADQDALWPDLDVVDQHAAKRQWQKAIPRRPFPIRCLPNVTHLRQK